MRKANSKYLFQRDGTYYMRMPVPKERRKDYGRAEIQKSLGTKDLGEAVVLLGPWVKKFQDDIAGVKGEVSHEAVRETRNRLKLPTYYVDEAIESPSEDSVALIGGGLETLGKIDTPTPTEFVAIGGALTQPKMTMRQAFEQYEKDVGSEWGPENTRNRDKIWNKLNDAVNTFEKFMGTDIDVLSMTKRDVYNYRTKLLAKRIPSDEIDPETGKKAKTWKTDTIRKKLIWLSVILRHIYQIEGLNESPFENLRPIKGNGDEEKRPPITEPEVKAIRKHMAKVGANEELQAILAVMENTGSSAKEIVLLTENDICLDGPIPYLAFQPNEHRTYLKTDSRVRKVPLAGIALVAMNRFPKGFPRYRYDGGAEALGATANKLIEAAAPGKTTYGYRHRMEDLMKAKGIEDTLRESIKGHASDMSGYYGTEYPLDIKLEVLKKVLPDHAYQL